MNQIEAHYRVPSCGSGKVFPQFEIIKNQRKMIEKNHIINVYSAKRTGVVKVMHAESLEITKVA